MNRLSSLVIATLCLPAALAAQQAPSSAPQSAQAQANPITTTFKAYDARYGGWLMAAFDSIPASRYGFKPTPAQQSVGYVAQHLADANYALCSRFSGKTRTMTAKDSLADTVKAAWPKDTLTARLKASFDFCRQALDAVTDAQLLEPVATGQQGAVPAPMRFRSSLAFVTDLVDHWSQMANYMRLMGMVPPSAQPRPRS